MGVFMAKSRMIVGFDGNQEPRNYEIWRDFNNFLLKISVALNKYPTNKITP